MRLSEDENYFEIEEKLLNEGYRFICGVDEAGRALWQDLFLLQQLLWTEKG